jgi:glutaredoxin
MSIVTLYSKPGCCLCDDAREELLRIKKDQPFELQVIDIQEDPALFAKYGEMIPVILLNGDFLFEYTVQEARLRELLKEVN